MVHFLQIVVQNLYMFWTMFDSVEIENWMLEKNVSPNFEHRHILLNLMVLVQMIVN